ncbi:arsenate reductase (glutaredoxin) [Pedobacter sp. KLB.chiD]|uniref:arsenate reductase (glutaredoxin) n=1 Tax=Pedobacter sp. KLB.chiD TaxID=3387402 RepID=UPI003999D9B3
MITIYHNNSCTKSRSALTAIENSGKAFNVVYYLETPPSKSELEEIISKLGIKPLELIRKGEKIFIENYKGKQLSDEEWIDAIIAHPILIERPIVISDHKAVIARPAEKMKEIWG